MNTIQECSTRRTSRRRSAALLATVALISLAFAFGTLPYASSVTQVLPNGVTFGAPGDMLGPPTGSGATQSSSHVYSPGKGGSVILELGQPIYDGVGTDLVIYENPFTRLGTLSSNWVEAFYVEVSSDGATFARFPSEYLGPVGPHQVSPGLDDTAEYAWFRGLAGVSPVWANPGAGVDPFHIVEGGGDAFDLEELADHALVQSGDVVLDSINFVRLVDVAGGVDVDSNGTPIWDCGNPSFSAGDIDAVAGISTLATLQSGYPSVDITLRPDNVIEITLEDSDGLWDIKSRIALALNGVELDFYGFLPLFNIVATPTEVTLRIGPVPAGFDPLEMKIAVRDSLGFTGGDALHVP
ncbi:MAG: hypothetical protein DHS20C15_27830 [Planctomycetota bacterium]|nr:MAG: hypothetical protein DHS20C15_27830 [Planctomycetota bacterium]